VARVNVVRVNVVRVTGVGAGNEPVQLGEARPDLGGAGGSGEIRPPGPGPRGEAELDVEIVRGREPDLSEDVLSAPIDEQMGAVAEQGKAPARKVQRPARRVLDQFPRVGRAVQGGHS